MGRRVAAVAVAEGVGQAPPPHRLWCLGLSWWNWLRGCGDRGVRGPSRRLAAVATPLGASGSAFSAFFFCGGLHAGIGAERVADVLDVPEVRVVWLRRVSGWRRPSRGIFDEEVQVYSERGRELLGNSRGVTQVIGAGGDLQVAIGLELGHVGVYL